MGRFHHHWVLLAAVLLAVPGSLLRADAGGAWRPVVRTTGADDEAREVRDYATRYAIGSALARTIYRQARALDVDPALAFAVIDTESKFDPRAVGPTGARGLMQIKLSTARMYDRRLTAERLLRPEVNVRYGLLHLKREVAHFDDWRLGLLAYNMGRAGLERALDRGLRPGSGYVARVQAECGGCI